MSHWLAAPKLMASVFGIGRSVRADSSRICFSCFAFGAPAPASVGAPLLVSWLVGVGNVARAPWQAPGSAWFRALRVRKLSTEERERVLALEKWESSDNLATTVQDQFARAAIKFVELYPERALPSNPQSRYSVVPARFIVNDEGTLSSGMASQAFPSEYHGLKLGRWWVSIHSAGQTTLTQGNYRRLMEVGAIRPSANHK